MLTSQLHPLLEVGGDLLLYSTEAQVLISQPDVILDPLLEVGEDLLLYLIAWESHSLLNLSSDLFSSGLH